MDGEKAALVEMGDLLDDVRSGSQLVPPFFLLLPAMVRKLTIASLVPRRFRNLVEARDLA
jgi:hypothetical protein